MKGRANNDIVWSLVLALLLHCQIIVLALQPLGNYFIPFYPLGAARQAAAVDVNSGSQVQSSPPVQGERVAGQVMRLTAGAGRLHLPATMAATAPNGAGDNLPAVLARGGRNLASDQRPPQFSAPLFGQNTIPPPPARNLGEQAADRDRDYLAGDILKNVRPATTADVLAAAGEEDFILAVHRDLTDGRLDMAFSTFILSAEYYLLLGVLLPQGLAPDFTLPNALDRYRERLGRVSAGLGEELDGFGLVMLLQRYAENKYYPENGSGLFLDSLYNQLNDCEGGSKEVLAYLADLYPELPVGTVRGMLRTTGGQFIGHMQVYLGPGAHTETIISGAKGGVVVETTRVGRDSIFAYQAGEINDLEDFVLQYYPQALLGTPLASRLNRDEDAVGDLPGLIAGTSNHPLKRGYATAGTLLSGQLYDLSAIRTRKIFNEFQTSTIPVCDPGIDPEAVTSANLFSNYVAIAPELRAELLQHYLANLTYWDNVLTPRWQKSSRVPGYADLLVSLQETSGQGYLPLAGERSLSLAALEGHRQLLALMAEPPGEVRWLGQGERQCEPEAQLDKNLIDYLLRTPTSPGVFFLPDTGRTPWHRLMQGVLDDCLAVNPDDGSPELLTELMSLASEQDLSLRKVLLDRMIQRGDDGERLSRLVATRLAAIKSIVSGDVPAGSNELVRRVSEAGTVWQPSVRESWLQRGRTGISPELVQDLVDLLGRRELFQLIAGYATRQDLQLTMERAYHLVDGLYALSAGDVDEMNLLVQGLTATPNAELALATVLVQGKIGGSDAVEVSRRLAEMLRGFPELSLSTFSFLLGNGLSRDDAGAVLGDRVAHLAGQAGVPLPPASYPEIHQLSKASALLGDSNVDAQISSLLTKSLHSRLVGPSSLGGNWEGGTSELLSELLLLAAQPGPRQERLAATLLEPFLTYAGEYPQARLMFGLIRKVFGDEVLAYRLQQEMAQQLNTAGSLESTADLAAAATLLGRVNAVVLFFLQQPDLALPSARVGVSQLLSHLVQVHRQLSQLGTFWSGQEKGYAALSSYYLDPRVRESFSLLAEGGGNTAELKFRKTRDISTIKDPHSVRVVAADRRITGQDISHLTLALNPANSMAALRRSWEATLAVLGHHVMLAPEDATLQRYLFTPHSPYLTENNSGFYLSPETLADVRNAEQWGGRNDILLSSYLHFKNMPEHLPPWLLRAAKNRSEAERAIIDKFQTQSFLPMILECAGDHAELPESFFKAKWVVRKPYGEDIFPATLLLVRLGYLAVDSAGRLVPTAKYEES